jgi:hypothetical protein
LGWYAREPDVYVSYGTVLFLENTSMALRQNSEFTSLNFRGERNYVMERNYWGFGLFPSFGILENRKHDVSESGSVSVLR